MNTSKSSLLTLSLGLTLAAGCSKTASDTTPPEPAMTEPTEPTPVVATEPEPTPEPTPAAEPLPPVPPPLSDGEIVAIAMAANDEALEHAKIAKTKAKDRRVKAFAKLMSKDHSDANKREAALVERAGLTTLDSEASRKLVEDTKARTETLTSAAKGAEFDRAYIEAQVQVHTQVLDMIDNQMLPAAQNAELKAEIDAHLSEAREIQAALTQPSA